ncbi:hypothetical protein J7T55_013135 [Diaporthe amygdali]|uniref:uncharacterized protein n=1 Tax=Phomopsis amygdali TaxID=1214568 RepID=UPI0022FDF3EF|nr:uncharacterized protein J7T55_013135 [Diaporthe amygdali]KAJ0118879.1 hypothetical protein J7T55_013135 [Diaporthe amygdali]
MRGRVRGRGNSPTGDFGTRPYCPSHALPTEEEVGFAFAAWSGVRLGKLGLRSRTANDAATNKSLVSTDERGWQAARAKEEGGRVSTRVASVAWVLQGIGRDLGSAPPAYQGSRAAGQQGSRAHAVPPDWNSGSWVMHAPLID